MDTVSIRDLRGEDLRQRAQRGEPFAITDHRLLIGLGVPVAVGWVEHLIEQNVSKVRASIAEGEQAMADAGTPMVTLESAMAEADATEFEADPNPEPLSKGERLAIPLVAAVAVGETIAHTPVAKEVIERIRSALTPYARRDTPVEPSARTVRIGDLNAKVIRQAGADGQTLALTHHRELIGIVIPITQDLVQFLIEQNLSRVLYNIVQGEKQLTTQDRMTTLDEVLDETSRRDDPHPSPLTAGQLQDRHNYSPC
jgi:hypothetical protein